MPLLYYGEPGSLEKRHTACSVNIAELAVESEPFTSAVSIADNLTRWWIRMPLIDIAEWIGWNRNASPFTELVPRKQIDGLRS